MLRTDVFSVATRPKVFCFLDMTTAMKWRSVELVSSLLHPQLVEASRDLPLVNVILFRSETRELWTALAEPSQWADQMI